MSYAATTTLINTVTTDAAFRTWGSAYAAKFASMGLVQTSDTGQINWTTVLAAVGANASQGYEIWRFADALQATAPIFLKIEYGSGAAAANGSLWFTVGSGTNGAGTLTGVTSVRQQVTCTATAGAITHYWSGDTNRLAVSVTGASAATSLGLYIERTVDTAGVVTAEGILIIYHSSSGWGQVAWNQATGPCSVVETSLGAMGPTTAPFGQYGTQVAIYPIFHNKGVFFPPGLNCMVYEAPLIAAGSFIAFTVYGAMHTYVTLATPHFGSCARSGFSTAANASLMARYE